MKPPPPLVIFGDDADTFTATLAFGVNQSELDQSHSLLEKRLPPVTSIASLSLLFGYSERFVGAMAKQPQRYYRHFRIKKGRSHREIYAPRVALKVIQKWLGQYWMMNVSLPEVVHGFVPTRSIVSAAATHCQAKWLMSFDIENYFPSITSSIVFSAILNLGYNRKAAHLLTDLTTLDSCLPQGSPASPIISNLVFQSTDTKISQLLPNDVRYTRYADDIVLSGTGDLPDDLKQSIEETVISDGWKLADHKTKLDRAPHKLLVHGLRVNDGTPKLSKAYRNRLRMIEHMLSKGTLPPRKIRRYMGHLAYAKSVL